MKKALFTLFLISCAISCYSQRLGNVTPEMSAGRVVDGVEITVDSLPYGRSRLGNITTPFTIQIVPKNVNNAEEVSMIMARYYQGNIPRHIPLAINQWNVCLLSQIPVNPENLTLFANYRVFVGFGEDIKSY